MGCTLATHQQTRIANRTKKIATTTQVQTLLISLDMVVDQGKAGWTEAGPPRPPCFNQGIAPAARTTWRNEMRTIFLTASLLLTTNALAQQQTPPTPTPPPHHPTGVKPDDKGPYTPEANAAYQGGGVVLQGQPGAPPPKPHPTPPGQTPANAVPQ
jgi:hypothetical protein